MAGNGLAEYDNSGSCCAIASGNRTPAQHRNFHGLKIVIVDGANVGTWFAWPGIGFAVDFETPPGRPNWPRRQGTSLPEESPTLGVTAGRRPPPASPRCTSTSEAQCRRSRDCSRSEE